MGTGRHSLKTKSNTTWGENSAYKAEDVTKEYDTSNLKVKTFRELSTLDASTFYSGLYKKYSDYQLMDMGLNANGLQRLAHELGITAERGTILPDKDFDRQVKTEALGGVELYRGSSKRAIDNLLYGDNAYLGDGIHGDGIYMSTDKSTALEYTSSGSTATMFIDKSVARPIKEHALRAMLKAESPEVKAMFRENNSSIASYAIYKGYNVIHVPGGNAGVSYAYTGSRGEDYYVPLTRKVLIFREHTKVTSRR